MIYDPALERAFCKDFIVNLNQREDIYPEYPVLEGRTMKKRVQWVWRKWKTDTLEEIDDAFKNDR